LFETAANNADTIRHENRHTNGIAVGLDHNRASAITVCPTFSMPLWRACLSVE
jgi:DNA-binding protein H-NS